jgi:hypothetical protein
MNNFKNSNGSSDNSRELEIKHMLKYGNKESLEFAICSKVRESDFEFAKELWQSSGIELSWHNLLNAARDLSDLDKERCVEMLGQVEKMEEFRTPREGMEMTIFFDLSWNKTSLRKYVMGRFIAEETVKEMAIDWISKWLERRSNCYYVVGVEYRRLEVSAMHNALSYLDRKEDLDKLLVRGHFLTVLNGLAQLEVDANFHDGLSKDEMGYVRELVEKLMPSVFEQWMKHKVESNIDAMSETGRKMILKMEREVLIGSAIKNVEQMHIKRRLAL